MKKVKLKSLVLVSICIISLMSCTVLDKISQKEYWEETCIEYIAVYDSCELAPKQFLTGAQMIIYTINGLEDDVRIWGKECNFETGDSLYKKYERWHQPGTGYPIWKGLLIDKNQNYIYTLVN